MALPAGTSVQTANTTNQRSAAESQSYYVQDNTFVVGGGASVDKGATGIGGGGDATSPLLLLGVAVATLLIGYTLKR